MNQPAQMGYKATEQMQTISQMERVVQIYINSEGSIRPHFILTGPSGSGKSHAIARLAEEAGVNFFEINAAQLTKEGTSGNSLSKALGVVGQRNGLGIVFVDEFDKLFISGNQNSNLAHETTNGVQNEFLRVLEAEYTSVFGDYGKYNNVKVGNILFVFAGAFNGQEDLTIDDMRDFGIKTEFLGRVGLVYNLTKLSLNSMHQVLINSAMFQHYCALFADVNKEKAICDIMTAVERNYENNTLGVRLVHSLTHQYFICGGLEQEVVKQTSFQKTLSFKPDPVGHI